MNVALAGCGFLGSLFATEVSRRWRALQPELKEPLQWVLFDPDVVDERNVANQAFGRMDIGRRKAVALGRLINGLIEDEASPYPRPVTMESWKPGPKAPPPPDLLVCAVDNVAARRMIWDLAQKLQVPLLILGATQQGQGFVFWTDLEEGIDTDPFSPTQMGKLDPEQIAAFEKLRELPPCELTGMRGLGLNTALAGMRAFFRFVGLDVEAGEVQRGERRYSLWNATIDGHKEVA